MRQWILRITAYASRLVDDLDRLPRWPDHVKNAQRNWIGRSVGHSFTLPTDAGIGIPVFTTRIETLGGVTFIAIAPDASLIRNLLPHASNRTEAEGYIEAARTRSDRDRMIAKDKTGVVLHGVCARNPVNGERIPIVIADYVLAAYGSGAVMGVPAEDARDAELAAALSLPVSDCLREGVLVHSGAYSGLDIETARARIAAEIGAEQTTNFKMRDWVFSRQRFWGEPFPIVWVAGQAAYARLLAGPAGAWAPAEPVTYSEDGVTRYAVPIIPEHLDQARLPVVASYEPTGEPSGPLAAVTEWVNVRIDPETGRLAEAGENSDLIPARRETNTMPQWAGSSWYWLRYMDPRNPDEPFSRQAAETWGPVDIYAGADHAVAHLIYARFWHKVMFDAGLVSFAEPFERLEFLGYVLAADGSKISKRSGNSRSPDEVMDEVGADALRLYEMALGPFEKAVPWIDDNLIGSRRFLDRLWRFVQGVLSKADGPSSPAVRLHLNRAVRKVGDDIEQFKFNTAASALNVLLNAIETLDLSREDCSVLIRLVAPFAPHVSEELWAALGRAASVHHAAWPAVDAAALIEATVTLPVQINGRRRGEVTVPSDADEAAVRLAVEAEPALRFWLDGIDIERLVLVPGRIVNIVGKAAR
jgi:leucyl-tRNA synthetase